MRMTTHSPIASPFVSVWPEALEKWSDHQIVPRKVCPSPEVYSKPACIWSNPTHKGNVDLQCVLPFSGIFLVIFELPEQALAQRTHSPGCFGVTQLLCYRDASLPPMKQPVNGCWMKLSPWLWVNTGKYRTPRVKWDTKICWVEEQSRQKPCHSWVSLELQMMQGNMCMVTNPKSASKMKSVGRWKHGLFPGVFVHVSFHLEWECINSAVLELV